jgi:hypothetical protein
MMIRIIRLNGTYDMVKPQMLDRLIDSMRITQFQRSGNWVDIRRDPVRRSSTSLYRGKEKRMGY